MEFRACSIFTKLYDEAKEQLDEVEINPTGKSCFSKDFNVEVLKHGLTDDNEIEIIDLGDSKYTLVSDVVLELFLSIACNHNVLSETDELGNILYQGASPDECVLVQAAQELGIEFIDKSGPYINLVIFNQKVKYELIHRFEYSSARMRSSVVVKDPNGVIKLYMKGADTAIIKRIDLYSSNYLLNKSKEDMEKFAKQGLRTLCYGVKILSQTELSEWELTYKDLKFRAIENKLLNKELEECIGVLESNITFLGVTALEDKLQDDVANCLNSFIEAGIEVFMLTGDKLDTAESIGYSCKYSKFIIFVNLH